MKIKLIINKKLNVEIKGGTITPHKTDADTMEQKPQGEATLEGAEYEIFDESGNVVGSIFTDLEGKAIKELPLGKYTVKEKTPSVGYLLDENVYEFTINENNLNPYVESYEKVIDAYTELKKVIWPTRQEAVQTTFIVFVAVSVVSLFLYLCDIVFLQIVRVFTL